MRLTKVSRHAGKTYIVLKSNDGEEHITLSINSDVDVSSNEEGTAMNIALPENKHSCCKYPE